MDSYTRRLSLLLLILLPILVLFIGPKTYWVLNLLALVLIIVEDKGIVKTSYYPILSLLILPVLWSFLSSVNSDFYPIIQSLFYLLTPILFFSLGMQASRTLSTTLILKYVIYAGTVGAIYYVGYTFIRVGFDIFSQLDLMRKNLSWVSISNVLAIIIILFYKEKKSIIGNNTLRTLILLLNILALLFTASRTYYLVFIIFVLIYTFNQNKKLFILVIGFLFVFITTIIAIKSDNLLIIKIKNSLTEITNSNDFSSTVDVYKYYRAYETKQAIETYLSGHELQLLFGHGFEKKVDLKSYVELAGSDWKNVPIIHNGYAYLLLRTGIFGMLLYMIFFLKLINIVFKNKDFKFFNLLIIGCMLALLMSNYVITSFFTTEMSFAWMLIGALYIQIEKEKTNTFAE